MVTAIGFGAAMLVGLGILYRLPGSEPGSADPAGTRVLTKAVQTPFVLLPAGTEVQPHPTHGLDQFIWARFAVPTAVLGVSVVAMQQQSRPSAPHGEPRVVRIAVELAESVVQAGWTCEGLLEFTLATDARSEAAAVPRFDSCALGQDALTDTLTLARGARVFRMAAGPSGPAWRVEAPVFRNTRVGRELTAATLFFDAERKLWAFSGTQAIDAVLADRCTRVVWTARQPEFPDASMDALQFSEPVCAAVNP